jgi:hypothetical protein
MVVLLSEQEIVQSLLFSPQADSTEKFRLFLEYLKLKGSRTTPTTTIQSDQGNEEIPIEPAIVEEEANRSRLIAATANSISNSTFNGKRRGRGRPKLSSKRITVSCRPVGEVVEPGKRGRMTTAIKLSQQPKGRRGRPPKRRVAAEEQKALERLAESCVADADAGHNELEGVEIPIGDFGQVDQEDQEDQEDQ